MVVQLRIYRCLKCYEVKRSDEFIPVIENDYWETDFNTGRIGYRTVQTLLCKDCYELLAN